LKPKIRKNNNIVSFYDYESIEHLIKYKYDKFGHRIFKILSGLSLKKFASEIKDSFYVIPIDDKIDKGFSHTAIMAKSMKNSYVTPIYHVLHSQNNTKYAGKSLEYRLNNPRDFKYTGPKEIDVILLDDISTTGLTLNEAKECLKKNGVNVALSVVLANLKK